MSGPPRSGPSGRPDARPWRPPSRGPAGAGPRRVSFDRSDRPRPVPPPRLELGEDEEIVAGRRPVEEAFAARRAAHRLLVVPERRAALDQLVLHATTLRIPVVEVEGGSLTALCGFDGHQGVALVVERRASGPRWTRCSHAPAPRPSRRSCSSLTISRIPRTWARSCAARRRPASTACSSRPAARPRSARQPSRPRRGRPSTCCWSRSTTSAGALVGPPCVHGLRDRRRRRERTAGDPRGRPARAAGARRGQRGRGHRLGTCVVASTLVVRIPMRGRVGSLNASVAGSVLLFEAVAQRGGSDARPADEPPRPRRPRARGPSRRPTPRADAAPDRAAPDGHRRAVTRGRLDAATAPDAAATDVRRRRRTSPPEPGRWRTCCPKCRRSARGGPTKKSDA